MNHLVDTIITSEIRNKWYECVSPTGNDLNGIQKMIDFRVQILATKLPW